MAKQTLGGRVAELEGSFKAIMSDLGEIKTTLRLANGNGKKPRKVEIMLGIMGFLVTAQAFGLVEKLRLTFALWTNGGPG